MDPLVTLIVLAYAVTSGLMVLSAVYFEVAYAIVNKIADSGRLVGNDIGIPDHQAASFLYPKWLHAGGHVSRWLQYLLALVVWYRFGWLVSICSFMIGYVVIRVAGVAACNLPAGQSFAVELMYVHLEQRIKQRQYKWNAATTEEFERVFEDLFKKAVELIDAMPARSNKSKQS